MSPAERDAGLRELGRLARQLDYLIGPGWSEPYLEDATSGDVDRAVNALRGIYAKIVEVHGGGHKWN
jgi:hypothetical protein